MGYLYSYGYVDNLANVILLNLGSNCMFVLNATVRQALGDNVLVIPLRIVHVEILSVLVFWR